MFPKNRMILYFYRSVLYECQKSIQRNFIRCRKLNNSHMTIQEAIVKEKEKIIPINKFVNRTHTCGELTINNINENVQLCGWVEFQRMEKFITLRDSYGSIQCIFDEKNIDSTRKLEKLPFESVICINGIVRPRPKKQCNPKMKTGSIEVSVKSLEILNLAMTQLPFYTKNFNIAKEALQMQYRYLALRSPELQRNLRIKSWVTMRMREYLVNQCGFVDVATPTLFRKTPGGAQEFIVPSRQLGKFYSLVQSPQLFKQLLMVGGMDKYFQFAQCYRDEGSRNDRQPEFTQLDIEMSFVDRDNVMLLTENLILNSWPESLGILQLPFQRLSYEEAMETYGSDCPDLRIPGKIHNISNLIKNMEEKFDKSFHIYGTVFYEKQEFFTKSDIQRIKNLSKEMFPNVKLIQLKILEPNLEQLDKLFLESTRKCIVNTFNLKKGDMFFLTYGSKSNARQLLGKIRIEVADILKIKGEIIRSKDYKFTWIYDFPLFTTNQVTKYLETTHHPFTHPHPEDIQYLFTNPLIVKGLQYDLVMNGSEIGGGSIRIHERALQEQIFNLLKIDSSEFYYLLEALSSGAPPHGGIALGLDRYISMICGSTSIRDVIAFPKTINGSDLMSGAPTLISDEDKNLYHIQITPNSNVIDHVNVI